MAYLLDEKKLINENIFKHEERMGSQYSRFLEKSPTFVMYYNISNIESTVDNGFQNVERILGDSSPLKFKKINDLPIYGIDQILPDLADEEQGLDSSFDGEAIILPNTIKPLPNDYFIINYLQQTFLFMVTQVSYDTIKSNNFYKISFTLKSVSEQNVEELEKQTVERYNCILTNIGTKEKCLIKEDDLDLLLSLNTIYYNIAERFKMLFYNTRYNSFLFVNSEDETKFYDKYQSYFINQHELFNQKNDFGTLYLNTEGMEPTFMMEYHDTIYQAVESNKKQFLKPYTFFPELPTGFTSIFTLYRDRSVRVLRMNLGNAPYIPEDLLLSIESGTVLDDENVARATIIKYFNNNISSIYDLDLEKLSDYNSFMDYSFETFVLIPILLYILRFYYNKFMTVN